MANPVQLGALSTEPAKPFTPPRIKHQDKAAWMVGGKGFFDDKDKFWRPGECLYFDGVPNADLVPLNKMAYERQQLWLDVQDELDEKVCKANKKAFVKRPRKEWKELSEIEDLPTPDSVMGVRKEGANEAIR